MQSEIKSLFNTDEKIYITRLENCFNIDIEYYHKIKFYDDVIEYAGIHTDVKKNITINKGT